MVPFLSLCGRVVKYGAKVGKFMGLKINIIYLENGMDNVLIIILGKPSNSLRENLDLFTLTVDCFHFLACQICC